MYRKDREKNDKTQKTIWRCILRRGCPGRAFTKWSDTDQCTIVVVTKEHSHPPDPTLPDELVEGFEVRKASPISTTYVPAPQRPRVDASTITQPPSQSALPDPLPPKRKQRKEDSSYPVDLDFDVDLNVHFPVDVHNPNTGFRGMGESSAYAMQRATKVGHMAEGRVPQAAVAAVLVKSQSMPETSETVRGYDFNDGVDYHRLFQSYTRTGFQATSVGKAIEEIDKMINCKLQPVPREQQTEINLNPCGRPKNNCTIFLSFTSNLISAGTREVIRYLVQHNMVDCLVTTAGGVEEDFIKCLAPTYLGDFSLPGRELRSKGINRIGNLLVPNNNYCLFEDWLTPLLDTMLQEQREQGIMWTPSKVIARLGREINNTDSVYYWAYRNNIPVFCPALTDGSLGDIIFFQSYKNPGLIIDIVDDLRRMNSQAMYAANTGMIILGGGVCKHHTCNANLMRNGADFSVFVNTAGEFDGSDSGARPDEAISWGKIKAAASPVKVYGEASVIFPILVGETFARRQAEFKCFFQSD